MNTPEAPYALFKQKVDALLYRPGSLKVTQQHVQDYWYDEDFTGSHFDRLADHDHPNKITERDLVAVTMLGVRVPAPVAIWMLSEEGAAQIEALLTSVPVDANIWSHPHLLDRDSDLWRLWRLLRSGCWPKAKRGNGMGRTITSKVWRRSAPPSCPSTTRSSKASSGLSTTTLGGLPLRPRRRGSCHVVDRHEQRTRASRPAASDRRRPVDGGQARRTGPIR